MAKKKYKTSQGIAPILGGLGILVIGFLYLSLITWKAILLLLVGVLLFIFGIYVFLQGKR